MALEFMVALVSHHPYTSFANQPPQQSDSVSNSTPHQNDWAIKALRDAIDRDGRGVKRYSREVLIRPPSTIYRWLKGTRPVPQCVRDHLVGKFRILSHSSGDDNGNEKLG